MGRDERFQVLKEEVHQNVSLVGQGIVLWWCRVTDWVTEDSETVEFRASRKVCLRGDDTLWFRGELCVFEVPS
ncbi:hypothetical protein LR48_Vigan03g141200 [Vigna angularis]|uniref:Uncharacterized protein n=1 Tax=Phaseolus angularis TaxID=3914 RepID=A0A0L9U5I1_PHAAN|nr:hypothetical protein LR48_Vigan03g141200 [Vigna angularis]